MLVETWLPRIIAAVPGSPIIGALLIGALSLLDRRPSERTVARIAAIVLWLSFLGALACASAWGHHGLEPIDARLGYWFKAKDYGFELAFYVDGIAVAMSLLVGLLLLATYKFSVTYLHREPGFVRFFALILAFAGGMQTLVLGGSFDLLFAGWEIVGITSVLLVAFFHERTGPVRAAIRVLVTYRLCDIGLLLGALWLHQAYHTTVYADLFRSPGTHGMTPGMVIAVGLAILFAAMGKSAQFPVGGWLPRAMEGPTASSAVFYGGLSVHAGVYLLLRAEPLYAHAPAVRAAIVVVGLVTAAIGTLSGQARADAKTALAYATLGQVGLMFAECGLGFTRLALLHLCAHALLRYYQFLRTPSTLEDALARRANLGVTAADQRAARWEGLGIRTRRYIYRLAIERFQVEATLERWVVRPVLRLSAALDELERHLMDGGPPRHDDASSVKPAPMIQAPRGAKRGA